MQSWLAGETTQFRSGAATNKPDCVLISSASYSGKKTWVRAALCHACTWAHQGQKMLLSNSSQENKRGLATVQNATGNPETNSGRRTATLFDERLLRRKSVATSEMSPTSAKGSCAPSPAAAPPSSAAAAAQAPAQVWGGWQLHKIERRNFWNTRGSGGHRLSLRYKADQPRGLLGGDPRPVPLHRTRPGSSPAADMDTTRAGQTGPDQTDPHN